MSIHLKVFFFLRSQNSCKNCFMISKKKVTPINCMHKMFLRKILKVSILKICNLKYLDIVDKYQISALLHLYYIYLQEHYVSLKHSSFQLVYIIQFFKMLALIIWISLDSSKYSMAMMTWPLIITSMNSLFPLVQLLYSFLIDLLGVTVTKLL